MYFRSEWLLSVTPVGQVIKLSLYKLYNIINHTIFRARFHAMITNNTLLRISNDGDVYVSIRLSLVLACHMLNGQTSWIISTRTQQCKSNFSGGFKQSIINARFIYILMIYNIAFKTFSHGHTSVRNASGVLWLQHKWRSLQLDAGSASLTLIISNSFLKLALEPFHAVKIMVVSSVGGKWPHFIINFRTISVSDPFSLQWNNNQWR